MEAGKTIAGKYRLNRLLGAGGMATVWSVTNTFTEREFAIKFMHPQVARTPEAARRFLLEAKVSARINHPNIIEVIDVGQTDEGALFLVMELLSGQSLDVAIHRQQPPMLVTDFLAVMHDVAEGLAAAHRSGVVHRDLKPTNIYLHRDREGRTAAKILDFGVSKVLEEENTSLTVEGTVLGSPLYMSPEQAMGASDIDGRTDVFAFGAILFEALTGTRAFDAPNFNALIVKIATKQPESIDALAPKLPESIRSLVRECLVTDKEKRLASFDDVADRISSILPQIEPLGLRLAPPHRVAEPSDPDATNALPVGRSPSERPAASKRPSLPAIPTLPRPTDPPKVPPPKGVEAVMTLMNELGTHIRKLPPRVLAIATAASGLLVLFTLVVGIVSLARGCGSSAQALPVAPVASASAKLARAAVSASASANIPSADEEVPRVPVDSLPTAGPGGRAASKSSNSRSKERGGAQ